MVSSFPLSILNLMSVGCTKLALATTVELTMFEGGVATAVRTIAMTSPATATLASTTVRAFFPLSLAIGTRLDSDVRFLIIFIDFSCFVYLLVVFVLVRSASWPTARVCCVTGPRRFPTSNHAKNC
jgi:hypothetical protein